MPSFDIVSEIDTQEVRNAVDQTAREVSNRFDFKGTAAAIEFSGKQITLKGDNEFQIRQVEEILHKKLTKRGIDLSALDPGKLETAGSAAKRDLAIREGIDKDSARKIVKKIKDAKLKVQASIQGEQVRVNGKKRDDLQEVIAMLKGANMGLPLQYINFRD